MKICRWGKHYKNIWKFQGKLGIFAIKQKDIFLYFAHTTHTRKEIFLYFMYVCIEMFLKVKMDHKMSLLTNV